MRHPYVLEKLRDVARFRPGVDASAKPSSSQTLLIIGVEAFHFRFDRAPEAGLGCQRNGTALGEIFGCA